MLWKPFESQFKWAVVVQKFVDNNNHYLCLDVGDVVYILRVCEEWYYGFKSNLPSKCGAFPKVCVSSIKNQFLAELSAELQTMFFRLTSSFMTGSSFPVEQISTALHKTWELNDSLSGKLTQFETKTILNNLLINLACAQRDLDLPILMRDKVSLSPVNPYSQTLVDFHKLHEMTFKEIKDARLIARAPISKQFSVRLSFERLPQADLTLYLVSQPITFPADTSLVHSSPNGNLVNGDLTYVDKSPPDVTCTSSIQLGTQVTRLTENVVISGFTQSSGEVVFMDLDPIQPRKERILLLVTVHRIGHMHLKRPKTSLKGNLPPPIPCTPSGDSLLRRPHGIACVDLSRELVQQCKSDASVLTSTSGSQSVSTAISRLVPITPTGEQFLQDALNQLIKDTPCSMWSSSEALNAQQTNHSSSTSNLNVPAPPPQGEADIVDFCLKSIEVLNPLQSEMFCSDSASKRTLGRRYGLPHVISSKHPHPKRTEVYVNLLSGDFFRGTKKQEKNIEVEISLRDNAGNLKQLTGPFPGNESGVYRSTVYYHKNHPRWSELFVISLPPSYSDHGLNSVDTGRRPSLHSNRWSINHHQASLDHAVPGSLVGDHLRFVCWHKSTTLHSKEKLLGVAFLRLQPSTSIPVLLADGVYQLTVHKMTMQQIESCAYLRESPSVSGPANSGSSSSGSQGSTGTGTILSSSSLSGFTSSRQRGEFLCVETLVCSDEHTTDEHLAKVLFWHKYPEDLVMCLRQGIYLSRKDAELRKFVLPLIDRLIQILNSTVNSTQDGSLQLNVSLGYSVLMALARCYHDLLINQVHQDRVKQYLASSNFRYPTVYRPYLRLLNSVLQDVLSVTSRADVKESPRREACHLDNKAVQMICSKIYWSFLVIVHSRQLELNRNSERDDVDGPGDSTDCFFTQQVDLFLAQVHKMVLLNENRILRALLLKHLPEIFKDLLTVYPATKLAHVVVDLIDRTLECSELPNQKILVETIQSDLFGQSQSREIVLPAVVRSLTTFFSQSLDRELVADRIETDVRMECWCDVLLLFTSRLLHVVDLDAGLYPIFVEHGFLRWVMQQLSRLLLFVQHTGDATVRSSLGLVEECRQPARPLLDEFPLEQSNPLPTAVASRLQSVTGCLTSVLLTGLQKLDHACWVRMLFPSDPTIEDASCRCVVCTRLRVLNAYDFIHELLNLFALLHRYPPYYSTEVSVKISSGVRFGDAWLELLLAASRAELGVLKSLAESIILPLCTGASPPSSFPNHCHTMTPDNPISMELINMLQHCLCTFATLQTHLDMDTLPSVMQSHVNLAMLQLEPDMRQQAWDQLVAIWNAIGDDYKPVYIPVFLPSVIDMATISLPALRSICVGWVFDAIRISPSAVERDFVSEVDRAMQFAGTRFAADLSRLLEDRLIATCTSPCRGQLDTNCEHLTRDLIRQVNCLLSYGEFLNHSSKLNEMLALHNLRAVYEKNGRTDMVLRYLYRLEHLHFQCGNEIERGNTLELISKHYTWSDDPVICLNVSRPYLRYACLSSRALRERLLWDSLGCLKRGTDWERAIEVCDQLVVLYRDVAPNYAKLSSVLSEQADLYQRVVSSQHARIPYHYYLLMFSGPGFASFIENCFIYRTTADSEELLRKLAEEFPQATRLITPPGPEHIPDHPIIFTRSNLTPQPCLPEHLASHAVDSRIKSYYMRNRVNCFTHIQHMKPKVTSDGREQPVAEETKYIVADCLPNIMPIVPVVRTETSILDPIQLATIRVQEMVSRLEQHLPLMSETTELKDLNPLIGTLTSSILSPTSGGLPKLLNSLEFSDEVNQESNVAKLSDSVLDLLEMQLMWLEFWYKIYPPPPARTCCTVDSADSTGNEYLQHTVNDYEQLVRNMSRKFGFSVNHLKVDHLRYGPASTVERRASSNAVSLRQAATSSGILKTTHLLPPRSRSAQPSHSCRVFHRLDGVQGTTDLPLTASLRVEKSRFTSRPSWDHVSSIASEAPTSRSMAPDSLTALLSTEAPSLPERPPSLDQPNPVDRPPSVDRTLPAMRPPARPSRGPPVHRSKDGEYPLYETNAPPVPPRPSASGVR